MSIIEWVFGNRAKPGRCEDCRYSTAKDSPFWPLRCHHPDVVDPAEPIEDGESTAFAREFTCKGRYFSAKTAHPTQATGE